MLVASGTYTGNDPSTVNIAVPFTPHVLLIKGGANIGVLWISPMPNANWKPATGATALQTSGGPTITATGFSVTGSVANTNAAATTYFWTAFQDNGAGDFAVFSYNQNNTDNRDIVIGGVQGNTPTFALIANNLGTVAICKFRPQTGDASQGLALAEGADAIQAFSAGGIQVGNATSVNGNTPATFYGFVMTNAALFYAFAAVYTGTGIAHNETDVGAAMTGDHAWVKQNTGSGTAFCHKHASHVTTASSVMGATADGATNITALVANGISVDTATATNGTSRTFCTALFKLGGTRPRGGRQGALGVF